MPVKRDVSDRYDFQGEARRVAASCRCVGAFRPAPRDRERSPMKRALPSAVAIVGDGLVIVAVFLPFGAVEDPQLELSFDGGLAFNQGKLMLGFALVGLASAVTRFLVSKRGLLGCCLPLWSLQESLSASSP